MIKAEQRAEEAYPRREVKKYTGFGLLTIDATGEQREAYVKGYQQAVDDVCEYLKEQQEDEFRDAFHIELEVIDNIIAKMKREGVYDEVISILKAEGKI